MGFLQALEAILKLGLPLMVISWLVYKWLYNTGEIDSGTNHKEFKSKIKNIRKFSLNTENKKIRFMLRKWVGFGSGFYGLAGLWTFLVIQGSEILTFIQGFGNFEFTQSDLIAFIINTVINQISNFFAAFFWFSYWPGPDESILIWILVAFIGYRVGFELARGRLTLPRLAEKKTSL